MSDSEEVKSKLDIVDIIREYIPVKAVGANFQAVCPFHNEKTPSFVISPDKQIWHCFGCGKGGDVFTFVMEKEGLGFMETLKMLAPKANVTLKNDNPEVYSKRSRLLDIMEFAGKYYSHVLKTSPNTKPKEYLAKRGLNEMAIEQWRLGLSPDSWSSLYDFLKQRPLTGNKFTDAEILAAGLVTKKEGGRGYYDRFRDRIMFPIWDVNNNIVAFTARVNPEKEKTEKMGKYINSPQTEIYDKSRILFALNKAKNAIRTRDLAIVVEGQMDAISCHNHGYENVVASSGTALTTEQITLIKRFTRNLALAFDMDNAGQMAADRGIREALTQNMNLKIITLPFGKDPDDCLRNNPDDFKKAIENAKPVLEYYFLKISSGLNLDDFDNKIIIRDKMFEMISLVMNDSERGLWLKRISEELDFSESDIREEYTKWSSKKKPEISRPILRNPVPEKPAMKPMGREELLSDLLLAILLKFPEFITYTLENLDSSQIYPELNQRFYKTLIIYYNKATSFSYEDFKVYLGESAPDLENHLNKLILLGEKDFYTYNQDEARTEVIKTVIELKKYSFQKKIKKLEKELLAAEREGSKEVGGGEKMAGLMSELKNATDELKKLI